MNFRGLGLRGFWVVGSGLWGSGIKGLGALGPGFRGLLGGAGDLVSRLKVGL